MKKALFLCALVIQSFAIQAQITYNSVNSVSVGDSIHISSSIAGLQNFRFDTTGANISWNFSSLPLASQSDSKWLDPSKAGYKNSWCASNSVVLGCNSKFTQFTDLGTQGLDSVVIGSVSFKNIVHHYKNGSSSLEYKMFGATIQVGGLPITVPIAYSNPDTVLSFPLQYGGKDSNNFVYSIDLNSLGVNFKNIVRGKRVNEVQGWGSITTPYKTYNSVLKVKTIIYKEDSLYTGQAITGKLDTTVKYSWYDVNEEIPVLEVEGTLVLGATVYSKANYIDTLRCITPKAFFTYSPLIPYYDTTTFSTDISFGNLSASSDSLLWDFGDGTTSNLINPTHTFKCPGIQNVKLIAVNKICHPFRIDTTLIPIYITDSTNYFNKTSSISICGGDSALINGNHETASGIYSKTYASQNGCDSIITVTLNVTTINKNVSNIGSSLTSNQLNAKYQWLDCGNNHAILTNDTSINYSPSSSGNYAVQITKNSCIDTSSCESVVITSIEQLPKNLIDNAYPNPAQNYIQIDFTQNGENKVSVFDLSGKIVTQYTSTKSSSQLNVSNYEKGMYTIRVQNSRTGTQQCITFVKK